MDHIYNKLQVNRQSNHKNNCSNYPLWNHQIIFTTTELKASQSRNKLQNILVQRKQQEYEKSWNERIEPHLKALRDSILTLVTEHIMCLVAISQYIGHSKYIIKAGLLLPHSVLKIKKLQKKKYTRGNKPERASSLV